MAKYEIDSNQFGKILRVCGRWHDSLVTVLRDQEISQLQLYHSDGWRGSDLDFLAGLPFLEGLYVWDTSGLDVSGVHFLGKLKRLHVNIWNMPSRPLAFEALVCLESCEIEWNPALESIFKCGWLKRLKVSDMKKVSLLDIHGLSHLEGFWLTRASGLKKIILPPENNKLSEIVLRKIPTLCEIVSWTTATKLTRLWLTECKRLEISAVAEARMLKVLDLHNMGLIPSLKFIENLKCLERLTLFGSTEVQDGKLAFALNLPKLKAVTFPPKTHYDITAQQARELLASR